MYFQKELVSFLTLASVVCAAPATSVAQAGQFKYLITFGDSYSQTGFSPTGTKPSSQNPLGNPAFPGYTTAGGANWIDNLITKQNSSLLLSYNFASGGATTSAALVKPFKNTVLSLIDQVAQLTSLALPKDATAANTLYATWMGVNDVGNVWSATNWGNLSVEIMDEYFKQMEILYTHGARNFLFLTVPPIEKTPTVSSRGNATVSGQAKAVAEYNTLLTNKAASFLGQGKNGKRAVREGKTWVYETKIAFEMAIASPQKYGAKDASCYNSDGKTCLWYNDYHPGMAIHLLVAEGIKAMGVPI